MTETQAQHYHDIIKHLRKIKKCNKTQKHDEAAAGDFVLSEESEEVPSKKICLDGNYFNFFYYDNKL